MSKIFIIAPHFPPSSLPPSQRVRLITRHIGDLGHDTTVFTLPHKYREEKPDEWMVDLAGKNFKKVEVRALSPKWTRKIGVGDLGLRWLPFLFPVLLLRAMKEKPDFILYPVPPWYLLIIAPVIKLFTGVKYGIDFIDPWVQSAQLPPNAGFKQKASQYVARMLEGWVCRHASIIYSVSDGINKDLLSRIPKLKNTPFHTVPYGFEMADFASFANADKGILNEVLQFKHIGSLAGEASYPVIEAVIKALKKVAESHKIRTEFVGTSYASGHLAQPALTSFIENNKAGDIIFEYPERVPYKKAVEMNMAADIMFLIGGLQPYYAASKLMGLIASQKPFVAFLHRESFPCIFLEQFGFPYLVKYSHYEGDMPGNHYAELVDKINELLANYSQFIPLDITNETIQQYSARAMTRQFTEPIEALLNK
jgi:hypothetical protein